MVPSPCISICNLDNGLGWCQGCYRTLDEIAEWAYMNDAQKQKVLEELDKRRRRAHPREVYPL